MAAARVSMVPPGSAERGATRGRFAVAAQLSKAGACLFDALFDASHACDSTITYRTEERTTPYPSRFSYLFLFSVIF